jgi:hypothetical protein
MSMKAALGRCVPILTTSRHLDALGLPDVASHPDGYNSLHCGHSHKFLVFPISLYFRPSGPCRTTPGPGLG